MPLAIGGFGPFCGELPVRQSPQWRRLLVFLAASLVCLPGSRLWADEDTAADSVTTFFEEEGLEPFAPKTPRSEAEQNRLDALALFAAGRMQEQAQDFAGALRLYQRALRRDPTALKVIELIVPLAFQLDRPAEGVRYALKAVDLNPTDANLLRQLAMHLTEQQDYAGALRLYRRALELEGTEAKSSAAVLLRLEMGRLSFLTQDYAGAAESFSHVVAALEKPAEYSLTDEARQAILNQPEKTWELFGESFLEADRHDEAAAAFRKVAETVPDPATLGYQLARVHLRAGRHRQALDALQDYFNAGASSRGAGPYDVLSQSLAGLDEQADLLPRLQGLYAADGENAPLGYFLAEQYRIAERWDEAAALLEPLVEKNPDRAGYVALADIYRRQGKTEKLLDLLGGLAEKTESLEALGDEYATLRADEATVSAVLDAARVRLAAGADDVGFGPRMAAALLALDSERFDAAGEFYEHALQSQPENSDSLLMGWGLGLLEKERYAAAAQVLRRGMDRQPQPAENPAFHFLLCGALEMDGLTDEALTVARQAVELTPDNPRLHSRVAWVLYHARRYDEARQAYEALIQRFEPQRNNVETSQEVRSARLALSNLCVVQNDLPQAEEWLEQVLDEYPEDIGAQNDLGYLWAEQGKKLERALAMIQNAIAAEPDNAAYLDSLGWVFYRLGRYAEAVPPLEKAVATGEPEGVILDHLGDVYLALNQMDEALAVWRQAVAAFDRETDAARIAATEEKIAKHAADGDAAARAPSPDPEPRP